MADSKTTNSEKKRKKPSHSQPSPKKHAKSSEQLQQEKESKEQMSFEQLGVCDSLLESLRKLKWSVPTKIQAEALPYALQGRDIIGLAETGSGKTDNPQPYFGLVLAPTRELAFQIYEQVLALGEDFGVKCVSIVGGISMMDQAIALAKKPHIIVATPGRIVDHLENTKGFSLRKLKYLVLDEADRLLNMDFEKEINKVLQVIPKERTTFLFSATMTSKVEKLQRASLSNPVKLEVSSKYQTVSGLLQSYMFVPLKYKECYLAYVLNEMTANSVMVFTSTSDQTQKLALMLRHLGFSAIPLHGKMTQPKRLAALSKFRSGDRGVLVATDVASRGLDIPAVDCVINYDLPAHSKDYIHRVGRTARAGRSGKAITIVTQYDVKLYLRIEKMIDQKLTEHPAPQNSVMMLLDKVSDALRVAALELKEAAAEKSKKRMKRK